MKVSEYQQMRAGLGKFKQFCDVADWLAWRHKHLSGVCSKLSLNTSYPTLDGYSRSCIVQPRMYALIKPTNKHATNFMTN